MKLSDWEPREFFYYFEKISAIPRGSGDEAGIADYLEAFAKEHGLISLRDSIHNVMIKKPGSEGKQSLPAVLLQGHTDMVCEKNAATQHDFETDPIELILEGDKLRANGTTLGADNGVAVAMMLAILADNSLVHPPLECLFTSQEEVGLLGAHAVDGSWIDAFTMINLDSGPEDTAIVSCAGGMRIDWTKRFAPEKASGSALRISLTGLMGGHSGTCIDRHRANSVKLMGRILQALPPFHLVSIDGGSKENAIPRECFVLLTTQQPDELAASVHAMAQTIRLELGEPDEGFAVAVEKTGEVNEQMSVKDTKDIVSLLMIAPSGVLSMSPTMEGLVETSVNLGVIKTSGNTVLFTFSPRSSVESKQDETEIRLRLLGEAFLCDVRSYNRYPGWKYNPIQRRARCCRRFTGSSLAVRSTSKPFMRASNADFCPAKPRSWTSSRQAPRSTMCTRRMSGCTCRRWTGCIGSLRACLRALHKHNALQQSFNCIDLTFHLPIPRKRV